jgi:hypothetical protein
MKRKKHTKSWKCDQKTKQRMDLSFFLSFRLFVFPADFDSSFVSFSAAPPPEAKRNDSKQKQNGSTRRRAGRTLHGIIRSVAAAAAASAKSRRTRERERERERGSKVGSKTR